MDWLIPLHDNMTEIESLHIWLTVAVVGILANSFALTILVIKVFWIDGFLRNRK